MERTIHFTVNTVRICIESKEPDVTGVAYTPLADAPIEFRDLGRLFLKLDEIFDEKGYPQAFQDKRTFGRVIKGANRFKGRPKVEFNEADYLAKRGNLSTFDIQIDTRRNSSWQGRIFDTEHNIIDTFAGDMQLMSLLMENI